MFKTSVKKRKDRPGKRALQTLSFVVIVMLRHLSLPSLFFSYESQCRQRAALHKYLPFAQKLPAYAPLLVQHALVLGDCRQEVEGLAGKETLQTRSLAAPTFPRIRTEVVSIRPPSGTTRARLGACSQEEEGHARKTLSPASVIRGAEVMYTQSNSCEVYSPRPRRRGNAYFQRTLRIRGQV